MLNDLEKRHAVRMGKDFARWGKRATNRIHSGARKWGVVFAVWSKGKKG